MLVALLLTGYSVVLLAGGGYDYNSLTNILSRVDHALLGDAHLYHKSPVDPEGLLSSLSAMTNTMIGFLVASWALRKERPELGHPHLVTLSRLLVCGAIMAFVGWLLQFGLPLNKRVWSPSYVLLTCGIAASLQGLLVGWLDIYRAQSQTTNSGSAGQPWLVKLTLWFGMNPLFLYVASEVVGILFGAIGIKDGAPCGDSQRLLGQCRLCCAVCRPARTDGLGTVEEAGVHQVMSSRLMSFACCTATYRIWQVQHRSAIGRQV